MCRWAATGSLCRLRSTLGVSAMPTGTRWGPAEEDPPEEWVPEDMAAAGASDARVLEPLASRPQRWHPPSGARERDSWDRRGVAWVVYHRGLRRKARGNARRGLRANPFDFSAAAEGGRGVEGKREGAGRVLSSVTGHSSSSTCLRARDLQRWARACRRGWRWACCQAANGRNEGFRSRGAASLTHFLTKQPFVCTAIFFSFLDDFFTYWKHLFFQDTSKQITS